MFNFNNRTSRHQPFTAKDFDMTLLRGTRKQREQSAKIQSDRVKLNSFW